MVGSSNPFVLWCIRGYQGVIRGIRGIRGCRSIRGPLINQGVNHGATGIYLTINKPRITLVFILDTVRCTYNQYRLAVGSLEAADLTRQRPMPARSVSNRPQLGGRRQEGVLRHAKSVRPKETQPSVKIWDCAYRGWTGSGGPSAIREHHGFVGTAKGHGIKRCTEAPQAAVAEMKSSMR